MIEGTVTDDGVPIVTLRVGHHDWPAVIDTGFNGESVLAEATFSNSHEILLGTGLLHRHHLEIDFPAKTTRLEQQR